MIIFQRIWKDIGWGSIIFLAALAGVDPQLYESSYLDGANRWQRVIYITLPSIRSTIMILLILRLGRFMEYGFEQIIVSVNAMNRAVGEVFNTYIYRVGIQNAQFSYTTAVGVFKSVVSLILVLSSNWLAKKMGDEGVF
jgi:putative aldouronate transport system permease protein